MGLRQYPIPAKGFESNTRWVVLALALASAIGCARCETATTISPAKAGGKLVKIVVVSTRGCRNTLATVQRIESTAKEIGARVSIDKIEIATRAEAVRYKFHGSPTVLVDGRELDPAKRNDTRYGFT